MQSVGAHSTVCATLTSPNPFTALTTPQHLGRLRTHLLGHCCKTSGLSSPCFEGTNQARRQSLTSQLLSGALELGERHCILMALGWTEIRILVAEALPALL